MLSPSQQFPDFNLPAVVRGLAKVDSAEFKGQWKLYVFFEPNRSQIGALELSYMVQMGTSLTARSIKALAVTSDSEFFRWTWDALFGKAEYSSQSGHSTD